MNKTTIIILSFLAIVILGFGVLFLTSADDEELATDQPTSTTTPTATPESTEPAGTTERYVTYSEDAIAEAEGEVVLFFHAVWCPQCVQLERDLKENGVPAGYTFIQVDFDQNQELRQQYGVNVQTTLIRLDENGDEVDRHVPYNEPTVEAVKRDFLGA